MIISETCDSSISIDIDDYIDDIKEQYKLVEANTPLIDNIIDYLRKDNQKKLADTIERLKLSSHSILKLEDLMK